MVMNEAQPNRRVEALGPAEKTIQTMLAFSDHMVHNRPGLVVADASSPTGVRWQAATVKDGIVYRLETVGRRKKSTRRVAVGSLDADTGEVRGANGQVVGQYRAPGLFPEVAAWLYRQAAEVWQLDNEFAAHWASWAFAQDHRDLKVVLAALMLVQNRWGEPVVEDGEVLFRDDDYREVGEAMVLVRRTDGRDLNPRLLLRVGELLELDVIAEINREFGFGKSLRNPAMGRYRAAVAKWLAQRERNERMLRGLVKAGFRRTVMKLARKVGYKPLSGRFFEILRWKQTQAEDGRREVALNLEIAAAESWIGLTEEDICKKIVAERPSYKQMVGRLPSDIGLTRAIMVAALEAGGISDAELIILTPTLEALGLLELEPVAERWMAACAKAENQRAAHIAERVQNADTKAHLEEAADKALQRDMAEAMRGLRVYFAVDVSGSMSNAIEEAKGYLSSFLQGFPLDKLTVAVFNSQGREVVIRHASAKGVEHAFKGFGAGGGTSHGSAFADVFAKAPKPAADEDALVMFVGDQGEVRSFGDAVRASGLNPVAFGLLDVTPNSRSSAIEDTAAELGIPCFGIDASMFGDAYAVSRTLRTLIASTPVGKSKSQRQALVPTILETELLTRPVWA